MKTEEQVRQLSKEECLTYLSRKAFKELGISEDGASITTSMPEDHYVGFMCIVFPNALHVDYYPFQVGYKFEVHGIGEISEVLSGNDEVKYKPIIEKAVEHVLLTKNAAKLTEEIAVLKEEIAALKVENDTLRVFPGGPDYVEALARFDAAKGKKN